MKGNPLLKGQLFFFLFFLSFFVLLEKLEMHDSTAF